MSSSASGYKNCKQFCESILKIYLPGGRQEAVFGHAYQKKSIFQKCVQKLQNVNLDLSQEEHFWLWGHLPAKNSCQSLNIQISRTNKVPKTSCLLSRNCNFQISRPNKLPKTSWIILFYLLQLPRHIKSWFTLPNLGLERCVEGFEHISEKLTRWKNSEVKWSLGPTPYSSTNPAFYIVMITCGRNGGQRKFWKCGMPLVF